MSTGTLAAILAPVLVFVAGVIGVGLKRRTERQAAILQAAKDKADREEAARQAQALLDATRAKEMYDQMQEDRDQDRAEARALRADLEKARTDMTAQQKAAIDLWSKFGAMQRAFESAEAYIAEVHRWDEGGRHGPLPKRNI